MENSKVAELVQLMFDVSRKNIDIDEYLDISCEQLEIKDWMSLAGFLVELDRTHSDSLDPKIRGMVISCMRGLKFNPVDYVLMYLRQENAVRLLSSGIHPATCPEDENSHAVAWALTTFWHRTRRSELEFVAKRHFGIRDCS